MSHSEPLAEVGHRAQAWAANAFDFLIGHDLKTLRDPLEAGWARALAAVSLASNFAGPEGTALKLLAKPVLKEIVESLAEHGGATAMTELLEKGGDRSLGTLARVLRDDVKAFPEAAQKRLESLLEEPGLRHLADRVHAFAQTPFGKELEAASKDGIDVTKRMGAYLHAAGIIPDIDAITGLLKSEETLRRGFGERLATAIAVSVGQNAVVKQAEATIAGGVHTFNDAAADPARTAHTWATSAYSFLIGDDIKTVRDAGAPVWLRVLSALSLASDVAGPEGTALKLLAKPLLKDAVESLAEHESTTAMKELIAKDGDASISSVARLLRNDLAALPETARKRLEALLEESALGKAIDLRVHAEIDAGKGGVEFAKRVGAYFKAAGIIPDVDTVKDLVRASEETQHTLAERLAIAAAVGVGQRAVAADYEHKIIDGMHVANTAASETRAAAGEAAGMIHRGVAGQSDHLRETAKTVERWTKGMTHEAFEKLMMRVEGAPHLPPPRSPPNRTRGLDIDR